MIRTKTGTNKIEAKTTVTNTTANRASVGRNRVGRAAGVYTVSGAGVEAIPKTPEGEVEFETRVQTRFGEAETQLEPRFSAAEAVVGTDADTEFSGTEAGTASVGGEATGARAAPRRSPK